MNTENYWACQCEGLAAVQARRILACPVCGGRDTFRIHVTPSMVKDAIAEAAKAYVEALSTDQPTHVTSALYTRWWALEHPVALWPDATRPSAPKFDWKEIKSFEGYSVEGPWGKAHVVHYEKTGIWGFVAYIGGYRVTPWRPYPRTCAEAKQAVETLVNRWEKGGRDE